MKPTVKYEKDSREMLVVTFLDFQMTSLIRAGVVTLVAALGWAGLRNWAQGGQVGWGRYPHT